MNRNRLTVGVVACVLLSGCGGVPSGGTAGSALGDLSQPVTGPICPGAATVQGVDVSEYQGSVNWGAVKASGRDFAIARIGDGYYMDGYFDGNWSGMKSAGLIRAAYQFFEPGENATTQANIVISKVGRLGPGDMPVMLDMEVTGGQSPATITAQIHTWVNAVTAGTGKVPFVYTGAYFWDDYIGSADFRNLALNVAWYGTNCPGIPSEWSHWTFHQYTSSGSVSGISGGADLDVFDGPLSALEAFANGGATLMETSSPLGHNADGRLEISWKGANGEGVHDFQQTAGGWYGWVGFGSLGLSTQPVMASNADGRLEVFARGTNGAVYHDWQTSPNGGWNGWASLGQGAPMPLEIGNGSVDRNQSYQVVPVTLGESVPGPTPAPVATPAPEGLAVARNKDGRLEVFTRGVDGSLHHAWQTTAGGAWSSWATLGGTITSAPNVGKNADGRLEVFARGADGGVYHIWEVSTGWSSWAALGGNMAYGSDLAVGNDTDGRLELFMKAASGAVEHIWQGAPNGTWGSWVSLGGEATSSPVLARNADGRLEVFARGGGGALYHLWQVSADGTWSTWASLGGSVSP